VGREPGVEVRRVLGAERERSWKARFAFVRVADAFASFNDDSVPHFAAENPDQAATIATMDRTTASAIEIQPGW
jgi:hypothetical protein